MHGTSSVYTSEPFAVAITPFTSKRNIKVRAVSDGLISYELLARPGPTDFSAGYFMHGDSRGKGCGGTE